MLEPLLFDEIEQLLELLIRLAGEADDEGGAQDSVWHRLADVGDALASLGDRGALHASEHVRWSHAEAAYRRTGAHWGGEPSSRPGAG